MKTPLIDSSAHRRQNWVSPVLFVFLIAVFSCAFLGFRSLSVAEKEVGTRKSPATSQDPKSSTLSGADDGSQVQTRSSNDRYFGTGMAMRSPENGPLPPLPLQSNALPISAATEGSSNSQQALPILASSLMQTEGDVQPEYRSMQGEPSSSMQGGPSSSIASDPRVQALKPRSDSPARPSSDSPEWNAAEGLLHLDLASSVQDTQEALEPAAEAPAEDVVVILDAIAAPRGPGRRTQTGVVRHDTGRAAVDAIRQRVDDILHSNRPNGREVLQTYMDRIAKLVRQSFIDDGLVAKYSFEARQWYHDRVGEEYNSSKNKASNAASSTARRISGSR